MEGVSLGLAETGLAPRSRMLFGGVAETSVRPHGPSWDKTCGSPLPTLQDTARSQNRDLRVNRAEIPRLIRISATEILGLDRIRINRPREFHGRRG